METDAAFFASSTAAQASIDAPVVMTSSINKICLFAMADGACN